MLGPEKVLRPLSESVHIPPEHAEHGHPHWTEEETEALRGPVSKAAE